MKIRKRRHPGLDLDVDDFSQCQKSQATVTAVSSLSLRRMPEITIDLLDVVPSIGGSSLPSQTVSERALSQHMEPSDEILEN